MIASGKLSIGQPCSPYSLTKSFVTTDGDVKTKQVEIVGRKLSLLELRLKLLNQHQKYMRSMTDQVIKELTRENICDRICENPPYREPCAMYLQAILLAQVIKSRNQYL